MYTEYHSITIQNKCRFICDNESCVNKLTWLLKEDFHHHGLHKETENEALQLILNLIANVNEKHLSLVYNHMMKDFNWSLEVDQWMP